MNVDDDYAVSKTRKFSGISNAAKITNLYGNPITDNKIAD